LEFEQNFEVLSKRRQLNPYGLKDSVEKKLEERNASSGSETHF